MRPQRRTLPVLCRVAVYSLLFGFGCQPVADTHPFPLHVSNPIRNSKALLLSEVLQTEESRELLDADFVLENRSAEPQSFALTRKSCSCYGVQLDGQPLELHEPVEISPSESVTLTFDVAPPGKAGEKSWSIRLASGEEPDQELQLALNVRVYADARFEPDAIVTTAGMTPTPELNKKATERQHKLTIRHTWRGDQKDGRPPILSGLPFGWDYAAPVVSDAVRKVEVGLWQQTWQTVVHDCLADTHVIDDATDNKREIRLKIPSIEDAGTDSEAVHDEAQASTGVFRLSATFEDPAGDSIVAHGRFLVREPAGVTAPSVVHWGQVEVGSSRTRRIILSASDERPFQIRGLRLKRKSGRAEPTVDELGRIENDSLTASEDVVWGYKSDDLEISVLPGPNRSSIRQSVQLNVIPQRDGEIDETLVFETDHPLTKNVNVRLRAIVKSVEAGG